MKNEISKPFNVGHDHGGDDTLHFGENMLITLNFGAFVRGRHITDCDEIWSDTLCTCLFYVVKVSLHVVPDSSIGGAIFKFSAVFTGGGPITEWPIAPPLRKKVIGSPGRPTEGTPHVHSQVVRS